MDTPNLEILQTFGLDTLPNLDVVVLGALELFDKTGIPTLDLGDYKIPLVLGSGNAAVTGRILFDDKNAIFADESTYKRKLENIKGIDGAILLSASGSKHAIALSQDLLSHGIETRLLTNNQEAPAKKYINDDNFFVFPKNREPYTYNTSTYMGMILGKTKENPKNIKKFITDEVDPIIPKNLADYDAFYVLIPERFDAFREMLATKFDELFQPKVSGRVFTPEQSKHAKSVVKYDKELFISFGYDNTQFGLPKNRLNIPLPVDVDYGTLMAVSYYVMGNMQKQHEPYFKNGIEDYVKKAGEAFGITLGVIVE
ncbi:MAG: hypothetical protein A2479_04025 [Candidatus Magasanikbacteria bacterium RIFOXYC2_FULL_39_8]|nr:MAG: hypothetical protein A2479_04025 [Candidatus Magasanikbacteria bacterium RIFOXYC2_FULL_39_8]